MSRLLVAVVAGFGGVVLGVALALPTLWRYPSMATAAFGPDWSRVALQDGGSLSERKREAIKALAIASVGDRLNDPHSAIFSDVRIVKDDTLKSVCGFVNAKNKFGAYVGRTAFFYLVALDVVKLWDTSDIRSPVNNYIREKCQAD